ncbi:hypothetical protein J6590_029377 [Homalodisca vitripennis]|nr:hypothetical protein J6590_029377 [Homalodisca vitripennis]
MMGAVSEQQNPSCYCHLCKLLNINPPVPVIKPQAILPAIGMEPPPPVAVVTSPPLPPEMQVNTPAVVQPSISG